MSDNNAKPAVKYRLLGRTGLKVSEISMGGIPLQRIDPSEAYLLLNRALDLGVNFIDTARVYTDSEQKIGQLKGRRSEFYLCSKTYSREYESAANDIKTSLETLQTKKIDIYLMHNVNSVTLLTKVLDRDSGALAALIEARDKGLIDFIGISSHKAEVLEEAVERFDFDVVELPFNYIEQDTIILIKKCRKKNIGTIVMKPFAGGAFTDKKAALRFVLAKDVSVVIPGMDSIEQLEENLAVTGKPSEEDLKSLMKDKEDLGPRFCRKCEYCLSECPNSINITMILLLNMYFTRYGLRDWAVKRYASMSQQADLCEECGACEDKCPYDLPIREILKESHELLG